LSDCNFTIFGFLAVRLTDEKLLAGIQKLQENILQLEPNYIDCLIPIERLHLTVCNIGLSDIVQRKMSASDDFRASVATNSTAQCFDVNSTELDDSSLSEDTIDKHLSAQCASLLNSLQESLVKSTVNLTIKLEGVGHFSNSTLHAKVNDSDGMLKNWVAKLIDIIGKSNFDVLEVFDFNAHVTLLKITRALATKLRTRYIDGRVCQHWKRLDVLENKSCRLCIYVKSLVTSMSMDFIKRWAF